MATTNPKIMVAQLSGWYLIENYGSSPCCGNEVRGNHAADIIGL